MNQSYGLYLVVFYSAWQLVHITHILQGFFFLYGVCTTYLQAVQAPHRTPPQSSPSQWQSCTQCWWVAPGAPAAWWVWWGGGAARSDAVHVGGRTRPRHTGLHSHSGSPGSGSPLTTNIMVCLILETWRYFSHYQPFPHRADFPLTEVCKPPYIHMVWSSI